MPSGSPIPYLAFAALNIYTLKHVNEEVRLPYMDEPFHVPQAQAYCLGDFTSYDPKLTTPPGLYLLSLALSRVFLLPCTVPVLRLTSTLLLLLLPPLLAHLLPLSKPPPRDEPPRTLWESLSPGYEAIVLALFPVAWFFGFLYYTDLGAVVCAVGSVICARRGRAGAAAAVGMMGILFRQTNVIWLLYAMSLQAFDILRSPPRPAPASPVVRVSPSADHVLDPPLSLASFGGTLYAIQSLVVSAITRTPELVTKLWPYIPPFVAFAGFIAWNGGIALGDRTNHMPTPHLPLPMYFLAFATAFAFPLLVTGPLGAVGLLKVVAGKMFGSPRRIIVTILWSATLMMAIRYFTIAHPFLLADNRHYPFYVWRRIFLLHPLMKYLLAPGYVSFFWIWAVRLGSHSVLPLLSLLVCTLLALIPTPLLEPRYFIIPYLLLRSQIETSPLGVALECTLYGAVNAGTMAIFLRKPFDGGWGEGMGRLMW